MFSNIQSCNFTITKPDTCFFPEFILENQYTNKRKVLFVYNGKLVDLHYSVQLGDDTHFHHYTYVSQYNSSLQILHQCLRLIQRCNILIRSSDSLDIQVLLSDALRSLQATSYFDSCNKLRNSSLKNKRNLSMDYNVQQIS